MVTNYIKCSILGYTRQEKNSFVKLHDMFYAMRTSFINYYCSFIFRTEVERLMRKENSSRISESDVNIREELLDFVSQTTVPSSTQNSSWP